MKTTTIQLTKRISVTLLNLERDALLYPLSLASGAANPPELPPGMTHDQAVASEGDYRIAYDEYVTRSTGLTNAAVIGWAMDVANIINFADDPPKPQKLAAEIQALDTLFESYASDFKDWGENAIINRGLKLISVVDGLRKISPGPLATIQTWLDATYKRWGVVDEKLVNDAIKSEGGDGGGGATDGGGVENPGGTEAAPV